MSIPSSVRITKDNIFTQTFANVYNTIKDNITDPNDSSGVRKFVYSHRAPHYEARNFAGFPHIIVEGNEPTQSNSTANWKKSLFDDVINIVILSQDKEADGEGNPSGADTLSTISDELIKILNENRMTLRNNGLRNMDFAGITFIPVEIRGKMTFRRDFPLIFSSVRNIT